jgi:hypothetical protein
MAQDEIHKNDVGTVFELTIKDGQATVDVSTTTAKQIIFRKPDGSTLTKTAAFVTDGTDGKIKYTTIAGDLDSSGIWEYQAKVTFSGGAWSADIKTFRVHDNLA